MKAKIFKKIGWGLVLVKKDPITKTKKVYHFCGYEKKPKDIEEEKIHLMSELITDKEFELTKKVLKTCIIEEATKSMIAYYNEKFINEIKPQYDKKT